MKDEDIFGMHLVRWISIFILACIVLFSFATHDGGFLFMKQNDKSCSKIKFNNSTIGKSGCGILCLYNTYTYITGEDIDIQVIVDMYHKKYPNQYVQGMDCSFIKYFCNEYDLEYNKISFSDIDTYINKGYIIIADCKAGTVSDIRHYVCIYGYETKKYLISNSATKGKGRNKTWITKEDIAYGYYAISYKDILK